MFRDLNPQFIQRATFDTPFGQIKEFYSEVYGSARITPAPLTNEPTLHMGRNINFNRDVAPEQVLAQMEEAWPYALKILNLWSVAGYRTAIRLANDYGYLYRPFVFNSEKTASEMLADMKISVEHNSVTHVSTVTFEDDSFYARISSDPAGTVVINIREAGIFVEYKRPQSEFEVNEILDEYEMLMQKNLVNYNGESVSLFDILSNMRMLYFAEWRKLDPESSTCGFVFNIHIYTSVLRGDTQTTPSIFLNRDREYDGEPWSYTVEEVAKINPVELFERDYEDELE